MLTCICICTSIMCLFSSKYPASIHTSSCIRVHDKYYNHIFFPSPERPKVSPCVTFVVRLFTCKYGNYLYTSIIHVNWLILRESGTGAHCYVANWHHLHLDPSDWLMHSIAFATLQVDCDMEYK